MSYEKIVIINFRCRVSTKWTISGPGNRESLSREAAIGIQTKHKCLPVVSADDVLATRETRHLTRVFVHVAVAAAHGPVPLRAHAAARTRLEKSVAVNPDHDLIS